MEKNLQTEKQIHVLQLLLLVMSEFFDYARFCMCSYAACLSYLHIVSCCVLISKS